MSDRAVIAFAPFVFEGNDLFVLPLLNDFGGDLCAGDQRIAVSDVLAIFELLSQFAGNAKLPIRQNVNASLECFGQSIRRFKVDRSLVAGGGGAQLAFALPAFDREKSSDEKFFGRKSGADKRGRN